jgi:hypothetical protein
MIGRGTRLHPGKDRATVIDIMDVTREHHLATLPSLFGLSGKFDLEGHTTDEVERAIQWVEANRPWVPIDQAESLSDLRYRCRRLDLLELETPKELHTSSSYAWVGLGKGGYRLGLKGGRAIMVAPTILGDWEVIFHKPSGESVIRSCRNLFIAVQEAEKYVEQELKDEVILVMRDTRWRREPASKKQIDYLRKRKITVPKGLTKGQASHLIGMLSSL